MRLYLNENIFSENDIFYYEEGEKVIKITERNWHKYLSEYGWEKINKKWIVKLNKLSKVKKKNSQYGVLDCGGDGDCLFHCISYALNEYNETDTEKLRLDLSEYITEERFKNIIEVYRILKITDDFCELWDPDSTTFEDFKELLKEGGNEYWGDFLILELLKEFLDINIVVFYSNDNTSEYYNYPMLDIYDDEKDTIVLFYEDEIHFKLVGHFSGNMMNIRFNSKNIPQEILSMVKIR